MSKSFICTFLCTLFLSFSVTFGATQGSAGPTSVGTVDITLTLADVVRISGLDDIIFPSYGGTGNLLDFDDLCIYSNTAGGAYNVTAVGSGGGGAFTVSDGVNTVPYNAGWNDVAGTYTGIALLTSGVVLTGQTGADTTSTDCSGGSNLTARLGIQFLEADLQAAVVSAYSGTLTLTIAPE